MWSCFLPAVHNVGLLLFTTYRRSEWASAAGRCSQ